jgi:hypothetical protein
MFIRPYTLREDIKCVPIFAKISEVDRNFKSISKFVVDFKGIGKEGYLFL